MADQNQGIASLSILIRRIEMHNIVQIKMQNATVKRAPSVLILERQGAITQAPRQQNLGFYCRRDVI